ncbi:MAG: histidine kinase N-terminal 7TM domain-containing protein [Salinirussus sp.]
MPVQLTPRVPILGVSLLLTLSLTAYGARQYRRGGHRSELLAFVLFLSALSLSLLAEISLRVVTSPALKRLGFNFLNAVALWVAVYSFLWFALAYSDNTRWVNRWTVGVAVATPVVFGTVTVFAPEYFYEVDGLVTRGPVTIAGLTFQQWVDLDRELKLPFFLASLYAYGVVLIGCGVLGRYLLRHRGDLYTGQAAALAVGIGSPLAATVLLVTGILPPELSVTGISYGVAGAAFGVATFRYRLLRAAPVGRERLVERMTDPVVMLDREERVVDCNPAARELVDAPADWRGTTAEDFFRPLPVRARRIVEGQPVESPVTVENDGKRRDFAPDISRIGDDQGLADAHLIVLRDITVQKEREQELQRQNERLDQFASTVSHDLRNPLNVAQLRADLARRECDSQHFDALGDALEQMEVLIDDLLTFARSGDSADEQTAVDLAEVAEASWKTVETSQATLRVETDLTVRADRNRLQQLLENLYRNAIEHGGPAVTVTVGAADDGFYVADDGPGIPDSERTEIFERGYSTSEAGTGFGLAIVEEIADAHGWEMQVTDSDAGGARFETTRVDDLTE